MEDIKHPVSPIRFGTFELDLQAGELSRQGRRIKLQEQPLQVLAILIERAGEVVTREHLQKQLWPGDTYVDFERGLNRAINKLREALADSADSPRFIETLPRRGYRFVAEVTAARRPEVPALQPSPLSAISLAREQVERTSGFRIPADHRKRRALLAAGIVLLAAGGWLATSRTRWWFGPPLIVLMDTSAPMGVYDATTRKNSGTNADDISDVLRDLPLVLHKEAVGSAWDREHLVLEPVPDLIVIHRTAFFHAMDVDFQVGYPPFDDSPGAPSADNGSSRFRLDFFIHLLAAAENRLEVFLGYAGSASPKTRFLIYSRGRPGEWAETAYRYDWVQNAERRFPVLKKRVFTLNVEGGETARIRDPGTVAKLRRSVESILALPSSGAVK